MKVADLQASAAFRRIEPGKVDGRPDIQKQGRLRKKPGGKSFDEVLKERIASQEGLKFSAHATTRIRQSNVNLSAHELSRLDSGVQKIAEKGGRDSLILLDDMAYVVSVKNNTVVTAVDKQRATDNVFTNIDSVIIV